jgi:hypothetical protein
MPTHSIHLATLCYGGVAQARYLRSLLALRSACARREVPLHLDLGGGEALASRGRAGMMARFLAGEATHLLFADSEAAFTPQEVFALLDAGREAAASEAQDAEGQPALLLISRDAARRVCEAFPQLHAALGDVRNAGAAGAAMVFEPVIEPGSGRYICDLRAFCRRLEETAAGA